MRKFLRLSLVCLMAMVGTLAFADTYKTLTFPDDNNANNKLSAYDKEWTAKIGNDSWSIFGFNNNNWNDNWTYIRCGRKSNVSTASIATDFAIDQSVSSVVVTFDKIDNADKINSISLVVASDASFSNVIETIDAPNKEAGDMIFEIANPTANNYYKLVIDCQATGKNGTVQISKLQYMTGTVKKSAGLKFSETSVSVVLGDVFTAPTLTKETSADPVYSSSDKDVATVDAATGDVTIVGVGTTTITATTEENDEYSAGSASYTLTVTAPALTEVTLPYYESFKDGIGSFTINDVNLSEGLSYVWAHDDYGYMKASAFVGGSGKASESWLVSPTIDLTSVSEATMKFTQTINFFSNVDEEATLWIKEEGGEWNQVTITYPTGEGWVSNDQTIDLKDYAGKKIQVGFKYVSTTESAGTWEIEDFSVTSVNTGDEVVTLPYEENFENGIGLFTIDDVELSDGLSYVWAHDGYGYMKASAFVGGSGKASESWLISPTIDLTNISEATLKFTQTINFFSNVDEEATLWIKEESGEWNQVTITYPTGEGWVSNDQTIDLKDYVGKKIKVGFKYVSTTASAGTWEIEDFSVTGTTTGIDNVTVDELDENAPIYNLAGQRVSKDAKGIVIQNGKKYIRR